MSGEGNTIIPSTIQILETMNIKEAKNIKARLDVVLGNLI